MQRLRDYNGCEIDVSVAPGDVADPDTVYAELVAHYGEEASSIENGKHNRRPELVRIRQAIAVAMVDVYGFGLRQTARAMGTDHNTTRERCEVAREKFPACARSWRPKNAGAA